MNVFDRLRYRLSTRGPTLTFRLHLLAYRLTGGLLIGTSGRMPVLLLTTTGRKSGQPRTWPLSYFRDGDRIVLIASNRGRPTHPGWYLNLVANPCANIQIRRRVRPVVAETAASEDRERLWARAVAMEPLYTQYARDTAREIPVVLVRDAPPTS
jgi:deazaflavin-dependent oxidoreductase (nitroreductase family)